ncbi:phosphate propanoyltransferase [Dielma fastidiosa]|uniref:Phosphate propanoyltransferase n=1 Tax=Dielma fastidiosa TaxID=1034346 RepID=A0A318KPE4_9FIRM|nr:phosphate propanoyltransferase [Dielma fastidiosa]PXX79639.1 putative phosphotransacetylase [Dielma fastidiosa]
MDNEILVEISARHVHVTEETFRILFGDDAVLGFKKALSQPGQFVSDKKVNLIGKKKNIMNVSILGPCRNLNQVEVSKTDARTLGADAPIRLSGDIEGTESIIIEGPCGSVTLEQGLMVAKRHVHLDPETAKKLNKSDGEIVNVKLTSEERSLVFGDVVVRVSEKYRPAVHLDTDEGNAANINGDTTGLILE